MKFTYYSIIGKDLNLLKGHVQNVKEYAGFDKLPCEKEFMMVVYKNSRIPEETTNEILEYCESQEISVCIYDEPTDDFLTNLYTCWNLGYSVAHEGHVFRGGSDQVFSRDSFLSLYEEAEKLKDTKFILQANTIENPVKLKEIGARSRHFAFDLGNTFEDFNYDDFEKYIEEINKKTNNELVTIEEALRIWGKPTRLMTSLGMIDRVDGCSWLMKRKDWQEYGPLPTLENGVTGDVIIHDRLQKAGFESYIVRDCMTYHFVQGESSSK